MVFSLVQCIVEAVSIMDIICSEDPSYVYRGFPCIKALYGRLNAELAFARVLLPIAQFYLNHSECPAACKETSLSFMAQCTRWIHAHLLLSYTLEWIEDLWHFHISTDHTEIIIYFFLLNDLARISCVPSITGLKF